MSKLLSYRAYHRAMQPMLPWKECPVLGVYSSPKHLYDVLGLLFCSQCLNLMNLTYDLLFEMCITSYLQN